MSRQTLHLVALRGFTEFERGTITSCLRLATGREPLYAIAATLDEAHWVIVDADHRDAVAAVERRGRLADAVCIGRQAPEGAAAWIPRPIETLHLLRELDALVALRRVGGPMYAPDAQSVARPTPRAAKAPLDGPSSHQGQAALLVDDSEIALRYLEVQLHRHGLRTERARNSQQALERLAQEPWDMVFVDLELGPGSELDGLQLCQRMAQLPVATGRRRPQLVIVSAHDAEIDRVRAALAGCDAFLGKPIDMPALVQLLYPMGEAGPAAL